MPNPKKSAGKTPAVSARKFYRSVVTIEVVSDEAGVSNLDLDDLQGEITEGGSSGLVISRQETEIDGAQAAKLLIAHGSDPEFLNLTTDGKDVG